MLAVSLDFLTPGAYPAGPYRDGAESKETTVEQYNTEAAKGLKAAVAADRIVWD
ncbi:MAG: hypothetical protein ACYTBJ_18195 [Planctomycetota bacterium]